jgi:hypothetical protein
MLHILLREQPLHPLFPSEINPMPRCTVGRIKALRAPLGQLPLQHGDAHAGLQFIWKNQVRGLESIAIPANIPEHGWPTRIPFSQMVINPFGYLGKKAKDN